MSVLKERISSLEARLKGFLSSVDDAQHLVTEADAKLKKCEMWLVLNGKFAENQTILDQTAEYQV